MLTDHQRALLAEKLERAHIKTREQSGRSLSYIEAWHAIAEANRIFGFDGWQRETIDTVCVHSGPRKVGRDGVDGWGVSYIAKVRIRVGDIVRDGTGAGHGIDRDLGLAHESAIKEAESDAMKRALSTFGNQFGLALYDKAQEGVEAAPAPLASRARRENDPAPRPEPSSSPKPTAAAAAATGVTVKTVYDQKKPFAAVFSDGKKFTFFSETLLAECLEAKLGGWAVRIEVERREKDGRVYENLKAIWPERSGDDDALPDAGPPDDEPPPFDDDPLPF